MTRLTQIAVALALAQRVAVAPHLERYERHEQAVRVAKAIRRTRPGR